jgi:hypothetical protein
MAVGLGSGSIDPADHPSISPVQPGKQTTGNMVRAKARTGAAPTSVTWWK